MFNQAGTFFVALLSSMYSGIKCPTQETISHNREITECSICLTDYKMRQINPCGHVFH